MTCPRRIVPGTTYLLTRRCSHFMLVPRGIVPELFGHCLALAAERHGVLVHAVTVMSNHYQAVVTDDGLAETLFVAPRRGRIRPWVGAFSATGS